MKHPPSALSLACLALALAAAVTGCAGKPGASGKTNPEPPAPISLSAKDTGSTQMMQVGQQLRLSLDSNPTTGYQWAVDGDIPMPLAQSDEATFAASSSAIGSGGTEVWAFVARAAGQGTLKLKYWRSFEATTPPVKSFEVKVDVK